MTRYRWRFGRVFDAAARFFFRFAPTRQTPPAAPPKHILVIECWSLGDLAILVPFLSNLRHSFPKAHISLLGNADFSSFFDGQKFVDNFIPARVPWTRYSSRWRKYNPLSLDWISLARTLLELRKLQFDWAFSGRMDVRDNLLLWLSGARRRIGYGIGGGGCFLTDLVTPDLSRPQRADIWLRLLQYTGESSRQELGGYCLADTEVAQACSFLVDLGIPSHAFLIGVHPGARSATRRWGEDRFAEVVHRLVKETDAHILWFSEPGKTHQAPPLERCHSVSVDFRLFLALLSQCRLLACNDSGPMHLANLLGVPVVAIFGPQRPESFGPRGPHDRVVMRPEFSCRPCFDYCVFDQPYCLRAISVDEVYESVKSSVSEIRRLEQIDISCADRTECVSHAS